MKYRTSLVTYRRTGRPVLLLSLLVTERSRLGPGEELRILISVPNGKMSNVRFFFVNLKKEYAARRQDEGCWSRAGQNGYGSLVVHDQVTFEDT